MRELERLVEEESGAYFNFCLLNLYHDANESMAWDSDVEDAEIELKRMPPTKQVHYPRINFIVGCIGRQWGFEQ